MIGGERRKNHFSSKTGQLDRRLRTLDATVREIYGCTFKEFLEKFFKLGYELGKEESFKAGRAAGRRAAKGIKETSRESGRPLEIDLNVLTLLLHYVGARAQGSTIAHAVRDFLHIMRFANGVSANKSRRETEEVLCLRDNSFKLPTQRQAINAYYRHWRKIKAGT
jgi:hypothetical protein